MLPLNGKKEEGESESSFPKSSSSPDLAPVIEEHSNVGSSPPEKDCIQMKPRLSPPGSPHIKEVAATEEKRPSSEDVFNADPPIVFKSKSDDIEQLAVNVIIEDIAPPPSPRTAAISIRRAEEAPGSPRAGSREPSSSPSALSRSISINTDDHEHLSSHPRHSSGRPMFSSPAGSPQPHRSPEKSPPCASHCQRSRAATIIGKPSSPPSPVKGKTRHLSHQQDSSHTDNSMERERSQTISVVSPRRNIMRTASVPVEPRRPGSFDSGFPSSNNTTPTKPVLPPHGGVSPSFLFLQLYHSSLLDAGPGRPLELPRAPVRETVTQRLQKWLNLHQAIHKPMLKCYTQVLKELKRTSV